MQQVFFTFGFLWFLVLLRVVRGPGTWCLGCGQIDRTSSTPSGQTGRTTKQWPYCVRINRITILPLFNILTKWTPPHFYAPLPTTSYPLERVLNAISPAVPSKATPPIPTAVIHSALLTSLPKFPGVSVVISAATVVVCKTRFTTVFLILENYKFSPKYKKHIKENLDVYLPVQTRWLCWRWLQVVAIRDLLLWAGTLDRIRRNTGLNSVPRWILWSHYCTRNTPGH